MNGAYEQFLCNALHDIAYMFRCSHHCVVQLDVAIPLPYTMSVSCTTFIKCAVYMHASSHLLRASMATALHPVSVGAWGVWTTCKTKAWASCHGPGAVFGDSANRSRVRKDPSLEQMATCEWNWWRMFHTYISICTYNIMYIHYIYIHV